MPGNLSQSRTALTPPHGVIPKLNPLTAVKGNKYTPMPSPVSKLTPPAGLAALCSPQCCEEAFACCCPSGF